MDYDSEAEESGGTDNESPRSSKALYDEHENESGDIADDSFDEEIKVLKIEKGMKSGEKPAFVKVKYTKTNA